MACNTIGERTMINYQVDQYIARISLHLFHLSRNHVKSLEFTPNHILSIMVESQFNDHFLSHAHARLHKPLASLLCDGGWGGGELSSAWDADLYLGIWQAVNNFNWMFHTENEHFYLFVHCPTNPTFDSRFVRKWGSWCILNTPRMDSWSSPPPFLTLIITLLSHGSQPQ